MLSGLRAAAAGLNTGTSAGNNSGAFKSNRSSVPSTSAQIQQKIVPFPQKPPKGVFSKDYYGKISDPTGRSLFYDPTGNIDVAEDGTILEAGDPIGFISIYDAPAPFYATENVIDTRIYVSELANTESAVKRIADFKTFQSNLATVRGYG